MTGAGGQARRAELLRRLHHDEQVLTLVNVWDAASARVVAATPGCVAIATASAAIAAAHGYEDGEHLPLDLAIAAVERIARAVELPVTADLERGYGDAGATTAAVLGAGAVGLNLEDVMDDTAVMARRVADAVAVGRQRGIPVVVNARTDVYLLRERWAAERRLAEALARGRAYLGAGADCVFVIGCTDEEHVRALVAGLGRGRVSLLAVPGLPDTRRLEEIGVARLSHGPYPHQQAMDALATYAEERTSATTPPRPPQP